MTVTITTPRVLEGSYLQDILAQPDALRAAIGGLNGFVPSAALADGLREGRYKQIVLTGMGSSLYALYPLHRRLSRSGMYSFWIETSELLLGFDGLFNSDTLLVAVSQSGESAEIVRLLERADEFGHVIGVTNNAESRLGRGADTVLLMYAGVESTVSCKTYLATLAVLHWLGALITGNSPSGAITELEKGESAVRDYLSRWREHVATLLSQLENVQSVFITGRGDSLATTGTGGLILKESTRHHAEGMSAAAFRHGPLEMVSKRVFVLAFAGDERVSALNRRLVMDVEKAGGRAALAATDGTGPFCLPVTPTPLLPLVEMLPVQMISQALAALDGREAGKFEHASKITSVE